MSDKKSPKTPDLEQLHGLANNADQAVDSARQAMDSARREAESAAQQTMAAAQQRFDAAHQRIDGAKQKVEQRVDAAKQKVDAARQKFDGAKHKVDQKVDAAKQKIDGAKQKVDAAKQKVAGAKKSIAKVQKLTTDARNVVAAVLNTVTSVAVVFSVVLGAKNVDVADRQLSLANQQLAALDAAESRSTARSQEWLKALERMRVEQAVESGVSALVAHFEPPAQLVRNQPAETVEISVQSLMNEPLSASIAVEVKGSSRSMMCVLPGCKDARDPGCQCHDPLHYDFVLEPMHMMSVGLPITLQPDSKARCAKKLEVEFEFRLQDAKGRMQSMDKRRVTYQREGSSDSCGRKASYRYLSGDSWDGTPVDMSRHHKHKDEVPLDGGVDAGAVGDGGAEEAPSRDAGVGDAGAEDPS